MDFINLTHPSQTSRLRGQAHSIAARATHARRRKARLAARAASRAPPPDEQAHHEQDSSDTSSEPSAVELSCKSASRDVPHGRVLVPAWRAQFSTPVSPLHADRKDPFASACVNLTWRDHFVLDQFVTTVVPYFKEHCGTIRASDEYDAKMKTHWVRMALADKSLMSGLFLLTYRFMTYVRQEHQYIRPALCHKIKCLQAMNSALTTPDAQWGDSTVALALILTLDEIIERDYPSASKHVEAALRVVDLRGGARAIGLSPYNEAMLHGYIHDKKLLRPGCEPPCGIRFMDPGT